MYDGTLSIYSRSCGKWGVSKRRVNQYCVEGRVSGAQRIGKAWAIPFDAEKPGDPRKQKKQSVNLKQTKVKELFSGFMPLMNTPFEAGHCLETIKNMKEGQKRILPWQNTIILVDRPKRP